MPAASVAVSPALLSSDEERRECARRRLYVAGQTVGWGGFLVVQALFYRALGQSFEARGARSVLPALVMVTSVGLLLTHYTRPLLARWGWKQLGWRTLIPRLLALAAVQSVIWTGLCFGYHRALDVAFGIPWSGRLHPALVLATSWINGVFLLGGWLCVYFFYHLFDRYNRLQIEQLRLAAHVKEAELRALKSQINPHFIFNALNSLRALIDENPARARQAVTQLANLLRYSLQSAQAETVAFEDELRVVSDYLALEQVRHEERLRVRLDVAPETLGLAVPPLLLQTLVENAVKYGISSRPEGGEIVIAARCGDGRLQLRVTNPGQWPAEPAPARAAPDGGSTGLGLRNAAERLRMFFGEGASLQVRGERESLVVAEVSIPLAAARS